MQKFETPEEFLPTILSYKATMNKIAWYWQKNSQVMQGGESSNKSKYTITLQVCHYSGRVLSKGSL